MEVNNTLYEMYVQCNFFLSLMNKIIDVRLIQQFTIQWCTGVFPKYHYLRLHVPIDHFKDDRQVLTL